MTRLLSPRHGFGRAPGRWPSGLAALLVLAVGAVSAAAEPYSVGTPERPWNTSGTTPGGVISFVNDLASVTDAGKALFDTADTLTGWIVPVRVDPGANISRDVVTRGGSIDLNLSSTEYDQDQLEGILSGDHKVAFDRKPIGGRAIQNNGVEITLDLGARFGVNRIVFYPRMTEQFAFANDFMRGYELYLNDGLAINAYDSGQPRFPSPVRRVTDNADTIVVTDIDPQFVRYIRLKSVINAGFEIDELEVYGTGFVPEAAYESLPLRMADESVWGAIRWVESIAGNPEDSSVEVRVRSGSDDTPDQYLRAIIANGVRTGLTPNDEQGNPITEASYQHLLREGKPVIKQTDGDNWSPWQLVSNGEGLSLPAPRRYFQFRVDFANQSLNATRALAHMQFDVGSPPVDALIAEVDPAQAVNGVDTTFTFAARVVNASGRAGFERFEIETPARATRVRSVEIQDAAGAVLGRADFSGADLALLPLEQGDFQLAAVEDHALGLVLPRVAADGTRIEVVFDAAVFRYNTRFQGRAYAAEADLPLLSEGGDASERFSTDDQLVRVTLSSRIAGSVAAVPRIFSPNGDGINDLTEIGYSILNVLAPSPVAVDIHDLSGRRVRRLLSDEAVSGRFTVPWDGLDGQGNPVPPGIYLVAVEIRSDSGTERLIGQVAVAY